MNNIAAAKKHINSAIKSILDSYNSAWYDNESKVDQTLMSEYDYEIYSEMYDAREQLIQAARKAA